MEKRLLLVAAVLAGLLTAPVDRAVAVGGQAAVDKLNAQRTAHGIPAGIRHVPEWTRWCDLHNAYMSLNGMGHAEEEGQPGYTEEGALAGATSVLSSSPSWDAENPWETAPIHLHQLLAPRLDAMGVGESHGFLCATTLLSRERAPAPANVVFTYPGNGARHRPSEVAGERPYTPGELVGIPAGSRTGPYLYVSADGPEIDLFDSATITAASLTGPDGPVELRTVDNNTDGLGGYLPTGGELIPLHPLLPRAAYRATVDLTVETGAGAVPFHHEWSFETLGRDPEASFTFSRGRIEFRSASPAPAEAVATRSATGGRGGPVQLRSGAETRFPLPPGRWDICVTQAAAGDFERYRECKTESVTGRARLELSSRARRRGRRLVARLSVAPPLRGQVARLRYEVTRRRCRLVRPSPGAARRRHCRQVRRGKRHVRQLRLRAHQTLRLPLPTRRGTVRLRVSTRAFASGDLRYPATSVTRRYRR